ncbi:hypothetical protein WJX82_007234 [Trebouxia sp. C0006]
MYTRPLRVLDGLVSAFSSMKTIDVCRVRNRSIDLVAKFINLEKCALGNRAAHPDLAPLQALPKLKDLVLRGNFRRVHHLAVLTGLECISGSVMGGQICKFAPILRRLVVDEGDDVNAWGRWDDGSDAPYYNTVYSTRGVFSMIPTGMRFLTQLHTLHLSTGEIEDIYGVASLCGISQMIPLADLSMSFGKCDEDIMRGAFLVVGTSASSRELAFVASTAPAMVPEASLPPQIAPDVAVLPEGSAAVVELSPGVPAEALGLNMAIS